MSRDDLLETNLKIIKQVAEGVKKTSPNAFVICITNPLDVIVMALQKYSGLPTNKVVGMAGILDSSRFKYFLSQELKVAVKNINALVLGGHGDSMVPMLTHTRVNGKSLKQLILENKIGKKFKVIGAVTQLGILGCDLKKWNDQTIRKNPLFCPDKSIVKLWEKYLLSIRKSGSSCGAVIEVRARGIPVGLGAPIYSKLDMDIASAMMSINAVKGVNIGSGMRAAQLTGEQNSDEISQKRKKLKFHSNNAGGILGGISTGQEIIVSFAVKPTSSILKSRKTIDKFGKNTSISVKGRHDPCVGIRAVPIGEAMLNCVLLDHYLLNKAQCGN